MLEVSPQVLQDAAHGINRTVATMSDLGISESGTLGRGFALLAFSPLQAGSAGVHDAMNTFTDRWSWGVRNLVQAANSIAETLGLAAGRYYTVEQQNEAALQRTTAELVGDPYLVAVDAHPDYDPRAIESAAAQIRQNPDVTRELGPQELADLAAGGR